MGDLMGSIFGSAKYTNQSQTPDPLSLAMNTLRYNQLNNLFDAGSMGGLLSGGGPFGNIAAAYAPAPNVDYLWNIAQNNLNNLPALGGYAQNDIYNQMQGLPNAMLGIGQGLANYPQQFQNLFAQGQQYPALMQQVASQALPYAQAMNNLFAQSQQYPAQAQAIGNQLSAYPNYFLQLAGALGQNAGIGAGGSFTPPQVTGGNTPPPATSGAGSTGGGAGGGGNFMSLEQYKQMGLDQAGRYIAEIAGPQLLQGFVAGGGGTGGAAQEAIAKAAAQVGMDFIKTLPTAAVQLGMLPAEYGKVLAETGLLGAQTGLTGAQTGLVGAQTGLTGAQTGLVGAQTGLTRGQTALLALQPLQAAYNAQLGQLQPLQLAMQGTQMGMPMLQGGLEATMAQLPALQAAYQATMGGLPALQGAYGAQLGQLQPLQAAQQGYLSMLQPLQYLQGLAGMGIQGAQGLMGMGDYDRALQEQNLMRAQQLMLAGLTGIPYSPSTFTTGYQRQPPLFGWFGFG